MKKGEKYVPPPEAIDPRNLDRGALDDILAGSDHGLIRTLASRANLGRVYGSAACSISDLDEDVQSDSLTIEQRDSLEASLKEMLGELDAGEGGNIWLSDAESKTSWMNAGNESERDSAAAGIIEFSPIKLPSMDEEMRVSVSSLSQVYDFIFGSHDAAAFIRREEEKLIETGERAEDEGSKLSRRASQQEKKKMTKEKHEKNRGNKVSV